MAYASITDVQAALPGRTISASSRPTITQVEAWIAEGDARLDGALAGIGLSVPVSAPASALIILRSWTMLYAEGRTRMAFATGGGDGTNDDGKDLVAQFGELLTWIRSRPAEAASELAAGSAPANTRRMRGYVLNNADGKTVTNGDFEPRFTKSDAEDQF